MQAHKDNGLGDFSEVMPGAWELAGPGGSTVPLISVFFVSCCTAVPTKISGSVLMDEAAQYRSNMHGNDPGQLLYQLVC